MSVTFTEAVGGQLAKLGAARKPLPTQRADRQKFPRAAGNVDPATSTRSADDWLKALADRQQNANPAMSRAEALAFSSNSPEFCEKFGIVPR